MLSNKGQRKVNLRLCRSDGPRARTKFQEAEVRRPILSVGESTEAENMLIFDKKESAILPAGTPEIMQIRALMQKVKDRLTMRKDKNTFMLDAWVEPAGFAR